MCDLLDIDIPIICVPFGPWEQVELAAAVSVAGGSAAWGPPCGRNGNGCASSPTSPSHQPHARPLNEDAFAATLRFRPAAISFHLAVPEDLIARAHDAGILLIQQVMSFERAEQAVAAGADVVIAQGGETEGNGGWVATMVLVPQVVDGAGDIPVVATGGIADGRGIAAAIVILGC